jgi:hypothetical protein
MDSQTQYPEYIKALLIQLELSSSIEDVLLEHAGKITTDVTLFEYYNKLDFDRERMMFNSKLDRKYAISLLKV